MIAETITVNIDPGQLAAQRSNNYSLCLAKVVNGQAAMIWQAMGPVATAMQPAYDLQTVFDIASPDYQVTYGRVVTRDGVSTFSTAGPAASIALGQTVRLDHDGVFSAPINNGAPGQIAIDNSLPGNLHAALLDAMGNPIFVDFLSGMDIGTTILEPVDTYRIWFDSDPKRASIGGGGNSSSVATVMFDEGVTDQVISYTADGQWRVDPLT